MPSTDLEKLKQLIKELVALGEDEAELAFWQEIFGTMTEEEQQKLLDNLSKEVEALKEVRK